MSNVHLHLPPSSTLTFADFLDDLRRQRGRSDRDRREGRPTDDTGLQNIVTQKGRVAHLSRSTVECASSSARILLSISAFWQQIFRFLYHFLDHFCH